MKKMYILVLDDVPIGFALNSVAHASVAITMKYKDNPDFQDWLTNSFRKVTCKVTWDEFVWACHNIEDIIVITESALDNKDVCLITNPRDEYPVEFKKFKLYK